MDYKGCTRLDDKAGQMRRLLWIGQRRECHTLLCESLFPLECKTRLTSGISAIVAIIVNAG
jgi:hypothetical protein